MARIDVYDSSGLVWEVRASDDGGVVLDFTIGKSENDEENLAFGCIVNVEEATRLLKQLTEALSTVHGEPPAVLTDHGEPPAVLTDYGLGQWILEADFDELNLNLEGTEVVAGGNGTTVYMYLPNKEKVVGTVELNLGTTEAMAILLGTIGKQSANSKNLGNDTGWGRVLINDLGARDQLTEDMSIALQCVEDEADENGQPTYDQLAKALVEVLLGKTPTSEASQPGKVER